MGPMWVRRDEGSLLVKGSIILMYGYKQACALVWCSYAWGSFYADRVFVSPLCKFAVFGLGSMSFNSHWYFLPLLSKILSYLSSNPWFWLMPSAPVSSFNPKNGTWWLKTCWMSYPKHSMISCSFSLNLMFCRSTINVNRNTARLSSSLDFLPSRINALSYLMLFCTISE